MLDGLGDITERFVVLVRLGPTSEIPSRGGQRHRFRIRGDYRSGSGVDARGRAVPRPPSRQDRYCPIQRAHGTGLGFDQYGWRDWTDRGWLDRNSCRHQPLPCWWSGEHLSDDVRIRCPADDRLQELAGLNCARAGQRFQRHVRRPRLAIRRFTVVHQHSAGPSSGLRDRTRVPVPSVTEIHRLVVGVELKSRRPLLLRAKARFLGPAERQLVLDARTRQVHGDQPGLDTVDVLEDA